MDSGQEYRDAVLASVPPMTEDTVWRAIDPRDRHKIECERFHMCGEDAVWATRQDNLHVCSYHRFVLDVQRIAETIQIPELCQAVGA